MIGLVLVTHGRLAAEFVTAMEHVVGPQEAIEAICIGPDDDMERRRKDIAKAIGKVDQGRSEEHTSELQSRRDLVCRLLLEKKKNKIQEIKVLRYKTKQEQKNK